MNTFENLGTICAFLDMSKSEYIEGVLSKKFEGLSNETTYGEMKKIAEIVDPRKEYNSDETIMNKEIALELIQNIPNILTLEDIISALSISGDRINNVSKQDIHFSSPFFLFGLNYFFDGYYLYSPILILFKLVYILFGCKFKKK